MGKKGSKRKSKKSKSKKDRAKNIESNLEKEQKKQKTSFDEISEIFLGSNPDQNMNNNSNSNQQQDTNSNSDNNTNSYENISQDSEAKATDNISESADENTENDTSADNSQCYDDLKAKQQQLMNDLKNLSDSIANLTLIRDNISSLSIEVLTNLYFTREVRPLIDAVNLISFASSNVSNAAQNITINPFGEKKEVKDALKISYTMNNEIELLLNTLTRRIKIYVEQLNNMDRNCPPFTFYKDS